MLLLGACEVVDELFTPKSDDTAGETAPDTAADTADTAGETGESASTLDTADPLCDEDFPATPPAGPDCLTAVIACGDTVRATTEGGSSEFNGDSYPDFFCFTNTSNHSYAGTERVYALDLEPEVYATATLRAPCVATGFAAMAWPAEDECPYDVGVTACEGSEALGGATLTFGGYTGVNRWLLVVDTPGSGPAPFELVVSCGS